MTSLIIVQSQAPTKSLFYSLVLPCTVKIEHPAAWISVTKSSVRYLSLNTLILQVTGFFIFCFNSFTIVLNNQIHFYNTKSFFSNKNAPYMPFLAIPYGHPRFKSIASHSS